MSNLMNMRNLLTSRRFFSRQFLLCSVWWRKLYCH